MFGITNKSNNYVVAFSGGRTSAFMAIFAKEYYKDKNIIFVFANTGKENEATLKFVDRVDREHNLGVVWLEAIINPIKGQGVKYKIVNYKTANRAGKPFEDLINKFGLPSKLHRHCTRDLKERVIQKYADSVFGTANHIRLVGIRADEKHRLSSKADTIYPLAEINVTKPFILNWWKRQPFDLELKEHEGNCDLCFLKSKRKRLTILKYNPEVADWWLDMEMIHSSLAQPIFDVRNGLSVSNLIDMSREDFEEFIPEVPQDFDPDLDFEFACYCSNT